MSIFPKINTGTELISAPFWKAKLFTNLGYIEDGPGEDLKYSQSPMISTPISQNPNLQPYFKPVSDQYSIGSCVANAVADSFEAQIAQRKGISPAQVEDLSRLFIYWNARNLENPPTCNVDKGSRIRLAFDCMSRYGCPAEKVYPYDISKVNVRPTILAYREAIKNRIDKFYKIDATGNARVSQIKQALSAGNPVVFGTRIANSFRLVNSDAIIYKPNGDWLGRHAMTVCGWSEDKQAFMVRNSWSVYWGNAGYCWMDKNYITSDITTDLWVPTI